MNIYIYIYIYLSPSRSLLLPLSLPLCLPRALSCSLSLSPSLCARAVYRDGGFAEYRRPVYARNKIEAVLKSNGFAASPFPHTWQCVERVPGNSTGGSNSTNGTTALPRT